ncbi:MAG: adenosylcobinamide-GDP ribazoletransferase [Deltaproteobacteria bacterium]|nr:adenosylcobinamide-GDP ribazoletransferase [Deltaproteobacteria bacterium]
MKHHLRYLLIAIQFMSIFRVKDYLAESPEEMAASVGYYPWVGLLLGTVTAGMWSVASLFFSPLVSAVVAVTTLTILTRGLHLDGLADTADGLLSHRDRARQLEIMKDSRIGTFGVLALILVLGLKTALLSELPDWRILLLVPVWGRWAVSFTAALSSYARAEGGLGRPFVNLTGRRELYLAGGATLVLSFLIMGLGGIIVTLVLTLAALLGVWTWQRQLGGVTGDILGAVIEMGETIGLLVSSTLSAC